MKDPPILGDFMYSSTWYSFVMVMPALVWVRSVHEDSGRCFRWFMDVIVVDAMLCFPVRDMNVLE